MSYDDARDLRAIWFGDTVALLGHLHTPRRDAADLALVICAAPFGYDNVCGHRGLRILADRVAASGIPALRFDPPGTGDSDGTQRVAAWTAAIGSAVAALRRETGCQRIVVMGVGLGGSVALAAADGGLELDGLILWGTPTRGRGWLREQRAYQRVAAIAPDPDVPAPPAPPEGIEELSGFPLTSDLAADLVALDLGVVPDGSWPDGRPRPDILAISRTSRGDESGLAAALALRGLGTELETWDGYDKMFDEPHLSIAPEGVFAGVTAWLVARRRGDGTIRAVGAESVTARIGEGGAVEEIARYSPGDDGRLFSIETRPVEREPDPVWVIFLTGRAVRHIGPNRMWVRFARELAEAGYASLRLDGRSVGDSDGEGHGLMPNEEYYQPFIWDDVQRVMELGVERGARGFLMIGICSGATASYEVAWRRSDVRGIVMLNPLQLRIDEADTERAQVNKALELLRNRDNWFELSSYRRAFSGEIPYGKLLRAPFKRLRRARADAPGDNYVVAGFHGLAAKPVEIDLFLSEGDGSVLFLERFAGAGLPGFEREHLRVRRVHNTDHTLRPLFSQELLLETLRASLERVVATPAEPQPVGERPTG